MTELGGRFPALRLDRPADGVLRGSAVRSQAAASLAMMGVVTDSDPWALGGVLPSAAGPAPPVAVVAARGITAGYGRRVVLRDVSVAAGATDIVVLLGANGAGRSTTLKVLAGELAPTAGTVALRGRAVAPSVEARAAAGFASVTGDVHPTLSVRDHLRLAGGDPSEWYDRFPELGNQRRRPAGTLAVGQQRLLAVVTALARRPSVLLVDELSRSTLPEDVDRAFLAIRDAADEGVAVVLAEQHVRRSLLIADHVVVLRRGEVTFAGTVSEAHRRIAEIETEYLFG